MLYFVATPIGNMGDITYRAVETLSKVDVIACEDTRNSRKLLDYYNIHKQLISYHKFNEKTSTDGIIKLLKEGKEVAVISDAGMPLISDPGQILINELNRQGLDYTIIPGANAATSALLLSGFDSEMFLFVGFLSDNNAKRKQQIEKIKNLQATLLFHISPHSLEKDVAYLNQQLGNRRACIVKEITKMFESKHYFNLGDDLAELDKRGEFVLVVDGCKNETSLQNLSLAEHLAFYLEMGMDKKEAIKLVAKERGVKKDEVYKLTLGETKND